MILLGYLTEVYGSKSLKAFWPFCDHPCVSPPQTTCTHTCFYFYFLTHTPMNISTPYLTVSVSNLNRHNRFWSSYKNIFFHWQLMSFFKKVIIKQNADPMASWMIIVLRLSCWQKLFWEQKRLDQKLNSTLYDRSSNCRQKCNDKVKCIRIF